MSFAVTAQVPDMYKWENLSESFKHGMREFNVIQVDEMMTNHYAWLLQIASWNYDIDWDPKAGLVSLEIPFVGKLQTINTVQDQLDFNNTTAKDNISSLFDLCIASVSFKRLISHFKEAE